jgi:orotidine-5'-phosphate decarboxylase
MIQEPRRRPYGVRLTEIVRARGPLCVGIDPHPGLLQAWDLSSDARGLERFARRVVEALGDRVSVFKPQSAFFEAHGAAGIAVLERVLADIAGSGALSLLDVKRGDIGSTMAAYAQAYLADASPLAADAITVSPYLGFGSLSPALDLAAATGRGLYVLALTSNPEGPEIQHARAAGDRMVGQIVVDAVAAANAVAGAEDRLGDVGVVVGATIGRTGVDFSALNGSILAPGLGAQGATADDLAAVFGTSTRWVLPSLSREVLRAGPDAGRLRQAAEQARGQVESVVGVG